MATVDIPGAFMQSNMEGKDVHINLEGKMVDILSKISPSLYMKYTKYTSLENGRKVMYVKLKKMLYGILQAALLFWKKFTNSLIKWGFTINSYEWCVANKIVNGE